MPTIKDVAREAGLAVGTVSRVLNNRGYISDSARKKVKEAMEHLDYQPNEMARSLQKKTNSTIGVIVPHIGHPYFSTLISFLEKESHKHGQKIYLLNSMGITDKESEFLELCRRNQVSGIILCNGNIDFSETALGEIPVINIERKKEGGHACISCDNELGGRLAAEHLIELGCRNLLHISGLTESELPAIDREKGFVGACESAGISYLVIKKQLFSYQLTDTPDFMISILEEYPEVDGVFTSDDILAAKLIQACYRKDIRIPDQLKIIGFDDTPFAMWTTPPLTTIHQPIEKIAEQALQMLADHHDNKQIPANVVLPVSLTVRETT